MSDKLFTHAQLRDAIWEELKEVDHTGDKNEKIYEVLGIVQGAVDRIKPIERNEVSAMWISVSDCMPEITKRPKLYIVKWYDDQMYVRTMTANQLADLIKNTLLEYFWLDESSATVQPNNVVDQLKNIQICDIDAPVFTHTNQFLSHFNYIKGKFLEIILKQSK